MASGGSSRQSRQLVSRAVPCRAMRSATGNHSLCEEM
jgi:hypothetical protein